METPECPNCITKPQMHEVKPNIWVCPVCDLTVIKRSNPTAPAAA